MNLNKIKHNPDVYRYLATGFFLLFITTLSATLGEVVVQPWLLSTLFKDIGRLIGLILIFYGLNEWSTQNSSYSFKLKKLSETDELTGLFTRSHFNKLLVSVLNSQRTEDKKFSILLINIDNFKLINEYHTQSGGDMVLKRFSSLLKNCVRKTDIIARWSGEEFIILLSNSDNKIAEQIAEMIRVKTELLCVEHDQDIINFTASIGAVSYHNELKSSELIYKAEQSLLAAKSAGKNKVSLNLEPITLP